MIEPPPLLRIAGIACLQPRNTPSAFTAMILRHCSTVVDSTSATMMMPALLTSTSRRPKRASVASITDRQLASSLTS